MHGQNHIKDILFVCLFVCHNSKYIIKCCPLLGSVIIFIYRNYVFHYVDLVKVIGYN